MKSERIYVSKDIVFDYENTFMLDKGILFYKKGEKKISFISEPIDI